MPANRQLIYRIASPYDQRHHNHHRIRDGLREPRLGFPNAHPHRHQLLPHPAGPEPVEDGFRGDVAEVDQGRSVAASDSLVLHSDDERVQYGKGMVNRLLPNLVMSICLPTATDVVRMEPCLRRPGRSFLVPIGYLSPQRPLGRL